MDAPKGFVSYSHDSDAHKQWVLRLATDLRNAGIEASLDQWDLAAGQDVVAFMTNGISSGIPSTFETIRTGALLRAPRDLYQTNLLWTDPDAPGMRAEAERQGYGGGTGMSFLRLSGVAVASTPFPIIEG
jgi:hypothetical protein